MSSNRIIPAQPVAILCKLVALLAVLLLAVLLSPVAMAQASGNAEVMILRPGTLIEGGPLDFGRIVPAATAQTITIGANDLCVTTGTLRVVSACRAAEFGGMATRNSIIRLRVNQNSINLSGPGAAMLLDNFTVHGSPDLTLQPGAFGFPRFRINTTSGAFTFKVGGRLRVNGNQAPGVYTGTFVVRLDYP